MVAAALMIDAGVPGSSARCRPRRASWRRLRRSARASASTGRSGRRLRAIVRGLDPARPVARGLSRRAARLFRGAGYAGSPATARRPEHAAIAAPYAHVTAPLRRLGDRFANELALAGPAGRPPARVGGRGAGPAAGGPGGRGPTAVGPRPGLCRLHRGDGPAGPRRSAVLGRGHRGGGGRSAGPVLRPGRVGAGGGDGLDRGRGGGGGVWSPVRPDEGRGRAAGWWRGDDRARSCCRTTCGGIPGLGRAPTVGDTGGTGWPRPRSEVDIAGLQEAEWPMLRDLAFGAPDPPLGGGRGGPTGGGRRVRARALAGGPFRRR